MSNEDDRLLTDDLNGERIVEMVRAAGVEAEVCMTGGNVATIYAGRVWKRGDYDYEHRAVCVGPGVYGWGVRPSEFHLSELFIGPDDFYGEEGGYDAWLVGARNERDVADLIIAQAQQEAPFPPLGCDELEALGFDGTGRGMARRR